MAKPILAKSESSLSPRRDRALETQIKKRFESPRDRAWGLAQPS